MSNRVIFFLITILISYNLKSQVYNVYLDIDNSKGCESLTVNTTSTFLAGNIDTLIIDFGDNQADTILNPPDTIYHTHSYNIVGSYTIKVTGIHETESKFDTDTVYIHPFPDASFTNQFYPYPGVTDTFFYSNRRYLFIANQPEDSNHIWSINENLQLSKTDSMGFNFLNIGNQFIKHTITVNGCTSTDSTYLEIIDEDIKIPNIFTPDGNGQNDIFYIQTKGKKKYTFTVWNRHGGQVFIAENVKVISWDGRTHWGELLNPGNYYFVLESESGDIWKGVIYLSR